MDSEMSDGTPVSPELDARMLAELREWRRRYPIASMHGITGDELDMLLRVAAERDALKAAACADPNDRFAPVPVRSVPFVAEIPDEIRERAASLTSICTHCGTLIDRASATSTWYHRDGSRDHRKFGGGHHAEPRPDPAS